MRTTHTAARVAGAPWAGVHSDPQAQRLFERVVESGNMKRAWQRVTQNRGGRGVDGRSIAATKLVVVGEPTVDDAARSYLETLRTEYGLPVYYAELDFESHTLGPEEESVR